MEASYIIMYCKNYLITTVLTLFVGSIFMPSMSMEVQGRDQLEQAERLIDCFFIIRVPRQGNNIFVRKEGAEPNGFEYYKKLINDYRDLEQVDAHKCAINELQKRYQQQKEEIDNNPRSTFLVNILYEQTLLNRGDYRDNIESRKEFVHEILDTLVNIGGTERNIAKRAFRNRLQNAFFNYDQLQLNRLINELCLQEDGNECIGEIRGDNSLTNKILSYLRKPTFICLSITTTIASYLIYHWYFGSK